MIQPMNTYILTNPCIYAMENKYIATVDISINTISEIIVAILLKSNAVLINLIAPYNIPIATPKGIDHKNAIDC